MTYFIIDRFEGMRVFIVHEGGTTFSLPCSLLPDEAREEDRKP